MTKKSLVVDAGLASAGARSVNNYLQLGKGGMDPLGGAAAPSTSPATACCFLILASTFLNLGLKKFSVWAEFWLKKLSVWARLRGILSDRRPVPVSNIFCMNVQLQAVSPAYMYMLNAHCF